MQHKSLSFSGGVVSLFIITHRNTPLNENNVIYVHSYKKKSIELTIFKEDIF